MGDISNPRLEGLTEKTRRWRFVIRHIAGATNFGPDALSRYPGRTESGGGVLGGLEDAVIVNASLRGVRLVLWEAVRAAGVSDQEYAALLHQMSAWPEVVGHYSRFRNGLSNVDGVALYKGCVVVPAELHGKVLDLLHQAHQGTTSMSLRAGGSVWWPGLARDLDRVRGSCATCRRNAPSQPAAPSKPLPSPDCPSSV